MARPKIPSQKKAYAQLRGRINQYTLLVQQVYEQLNKEVASMVARLGYDGSKPFRFSDYPQTSKAVRDLQEKFVGNLHSVIYTSTSREWKESNLLQDLVADKAMKFYGIKTRKGRIKKYYQTNSDALKAFQERKDKGLKLSQKLWNQSEDYKREMEHAISSAVQKGTSAIALSKRLSKYLNDFPSLKADYGKRFGKARDVKDCEYRSIRLARTEINMAYRTAEQERWKQFDFVLGYEVKLTQNGRHVPDICDDLAGKYPKDFVFKGWHPNCMCYVIPILKTEEQFWNDEDVSEITEPPKNFTDWLEANAERIDKAAENDTLPYWYTDNAKYVKVPKKEVWLMNDQNRMELVQRGFEESSLISVNGFNDSTMSGFDILRFDKIFEDTYKGFGFQSDIKRLSYDDGDVVLTYVARKGDERIVLSRIFSYRKANGGKIRYVEHDIFSLPASIQGKGVSKKVFRELFDQYEKCGIDRVTTMAGMDVGGLCWAKYGFSGRKDDVVKAIDKALSNGKITQEEYKLSMSYVNNFEKFVPMQDLAYSTFGERLLKGSSWYGRIDLHNSGQMEYLHKYLGM